MSEDIVHYDPPQTAPSLSSSSSSSLIKPSLSRRSTLQPNATPPTENILEIKASTHAYPSWWKAETERDSKSGNRPSLPRRESTGEVLERNVIFVDTPGYGSFDDVRLLILNLANTSSMTCWHAYQDTLKKTTTKSIVFLMQMRIEPQISFLFSRTESIVSI